MAPHLLNENSSTKVLLALARHLDHAVDEAGGDGDLDGLTAGLGERLDVGDVGVGFGQEALDAADVDDQAVFVADHVAAHHGARDLAAHGEPFHRLLHRRCLLRNPHEGTTAFDTRFDDFDLDGAAGGEVVEAGALGLGVVAGDFADVQQALDATDVDEGTEAVQAAVVLVALGGGGAADGEADDFADVDGGDGVDQGVLALDAGGFIAQGEDHGLAQLDARHLNTLDLLHAGADDGHFDFAADGVDQAGEAGVALGAVAAGQGDDGQVGHGVAVDLDEQALGVAVLAARHLAHDDLVDGDIDRRGGRRGGRSGGGAVGDRGGVAGAISRSGAVAVAVGRSAGSGGVGESGIDHGVAVDGGDDGVHG